MFTFSPEVQDLRRRVAAFMDEHIYPNEKRFYREAEELGPWKVTPILDELKPKAPEAGLWNLFLPRSHESGGLSLCRSRLSTYKCPSEVRLVRSQDQLPRGTSGKVQRQLVERWARESVS